MPGAGIVPYPLLAALATCMLPYGAENLMQAAAVGECSNVMVGFTVIVSALTVGALCAWSRSVKGDHGHIQRILGPMMNAWTIPLFTFVNALIEEIEFRVILMSALLPFAEAESTTWVFMLTLVLVQAILFAVQHVAAGFPCGETGFLLVLVWGFVLGLIRTVDRGILLVYVVHVFADLTIALLMYTEHQREGKTAKKE